MESAHSINSAHFVKENFMKSHMKVVLVAVVLALGTAIPAMAQLDTEVTVTTSVPFYAGKVEMPAGSYEIRQPDINVDELLIQGSDGKPSAFVDFVPTYSIEPQQKTDVSFQKYGDVEYLDRISIEGKIDGMSLTPTKAERDAKSAAGDEEHPVAGN
jgi:hypothetical protein